MISVSN